MKYLEKLLKKYPYLTIGATIALKTDKSILDKSYFQYRTVKGYYPSFFKPYWNIQTNTGISGFKDCILKEDFDKKYKK
jgi:hypothetical protein